MQYLIIAGIILLMFLRHHEWKMKGRLVGHDKCNCFVTESQVFEMGNSFLVNDDDSQKLIN